MTTSAVPPIRFESLVLKHGAHGSPEKGMCVMEAVAYFRGLEHTDRPPCVSVAIGGFLRAWNDALDDETRQMLKSYVFKVVGTATTPEDELRRAWMATDWLVRVFAPAWLDLAGLGSHGTKLRELPELTTDELAGAAQETIAAARSAAESAVWSAARSAAGSAAWSAARSAARSAAESAVWSAAWSAAGSALGPTVESLQGSALRLLDRMIEVGKVEAAA